MKQVRIAVFLAVLCIISTVNIKNTEATANIAWEVSNRKEAYGAGRLFPPADFFTRNEPQEEPLVSEVVIPPEPETKTVRISAVGDLMVHEWQMRDAYVAETGEYDFSNDFEMITKYLGKSDYRVGNLETVFAGKDIGYSDYPMFNSPDSFGKAIKEAGFDLLTTANNHSLDKREAGLLRTLDVLDGLGVSHVGTYRSDEERSNYAIKDINGIKFAFLSYTYGTNGIAVPSGKNYLINIMDRELIKSDMEEVKKQNPDIIVVMPHMGNEYELAPKQVFIDWIDFMIDCGADVVLASHPHVLQPMKVREQLDADGTERTVFIAYSLGNFISSQRTQPRDAGIIVNMEFEKTGEEKCIISKVSFIPTWVQFTNQSGLDYVRVLGIADVLQQYENGIENQLRAKDITRLRNVHKETTAIYIEGGVPLEEIKVEYTFYELNPEQTDELSTNIEQ